MKHQTTSQKSQDWLKVSEIFYSLQGEGPTIGKPSFFLRLTGCNLFCQGDWVCDTIEVWKKGKKMSFESINYEMVNLYYGRDPFANKNISLVVTGGEPMLQQDRVYEYFEYLSTIAMFDYEIETNGTITPNENLQRLSRFQGVRWNCSPKLPSTGEPAEKRINKDALYFLSMQPLSCFKFVIATPDDIAAIMDEYRHLIKHYKEKIYLMPAADSREQLIENSTWVAEVCKNLGVNFSNRLQLQVWDKATGV